MRREGRPARDAAPHTTSTTTPKIVTHGDDSLAALAGQAWELRATPYVVDAVAALLDWHDRRHLRQLEQRQQSLARLVRFLRDTDPDRMPRRRAA